MYRRPIPPHSHWELAAKEIMQAPPKQCERNGTPDNKDSGTHIASNQDHPDRLFAAGTLAVPPHGPSSRTISTIHTLPLPLLGLPLKSENAEIPACPQTADVRGSRGFPSAWDARIGKKGWADFGFKRKPNQVCGPAIGWGSATTRLHSARRAQNLRRRGAKLFDIRSAETASGDRPKGGWAVPSMSLGATRLAAMARSSRAAKSPSA
jgi:hypothetical protein